MRSLLTVFLFLCCLPSTVHATQTLTNLQPIQGFWKVWGDGHAEVAIYELSTERYGERREGYAVSIVVTEPWNVAKSVKSDQAQGPDVVPAIKHNLIRHFQTGIYDYHTMTSTFSALASHEKVAQHGGLKVTFSAQEWCGQTFHALELKPDATLSAHLSYFESDPRGQSRLAPLLTEDHLWLAVRGFQNTPIPKVLVRSTYDVRIHHAPLAPLAMSIQRSERTLRIQTPRGDFTFALGASPHEPLLGWTTPWNERAQLISAKRVPYWKLNSEAGLQELIDLGLKSASTRLKRTP